MVASHAPCTSVVRTLDRGRTWVGLPAPAEPVGQPGLGGAPAVWGIRFARPEHGFVFGDGLWETTDGGQAASWLFYSGDAGSSWRIVHTEDDGGMGWADLGFTIATDGVVVHGPADADGNSTQRPGQLFLTSDGGTTWHQVSF